MSALPLGGSGDLFSKGGSGLGGFQYANKESRSSYNMDSKKKRRAPQPPAGLQQYKPKILSSDSTVNVPVHRSDDTPVRPPRPSKNRGLGNASSSSDINGSKPIVMGDKDVPMAFPGTEDDPEEINLNVSELNLTSHDLLSKGHDGGTDNPLFHMHDESSAVPQHTDNPLFHMHNDTTIPQSTGSPLFDIHDSNSAVPHPLEDSVLSLHDDSLSAQAPEDNLLFSMQEESHSSPQPRSVSDHDDTEQRKKEEEPDGVYIPAPDYEEEEMMMAIPEEPEEDYPGKQQRPTKVFKEYAGEDFGQYLSDDENGYEEILRRASRPNLQMDNRSKTEVKRPQNKKREPLPMKNKKDKSGFSSLRNFSYADSKFGTITGQKKNPNHASRPEGSKEAEMFVNTGDSYEQFLYSKNGEDPRQVGMDHSSGHSASSGYPGQAHSRDSVWKKFTWKMKKQVNSFDLTASS